MRIYWNQPNVDHIPTRTYFISGEAQPVVNLYFELLAFLLDLKLYGPPKISEGVVAMSKSE